MIECSNNRMLGSEITDPKVKPYTNILCSISLP